MYKEKLYEMIFEKQVLDLIHGYTDSYLYLGTNRYFQTLKIVAETTLSLIHYVAEGL